MTSRSSPVKIAYVSTDSDLFGSEVSLLAAVERLNRAEFSARIVTLVDGPLEALARSKGLVIERLPWLHRALVHRWLMPWTAFRLAYWLRRERVDILEFNQRNFYLLLIAWPAVRLAGTRLVFRERMHAARPLVGFRRFLVSRVDLVLAVSRGAVASWRDQAPAWWARFLNRSLIVVPSGRDIVQLQALLPDRAFVRALGVPDHARLVGMVGALSPRKRPELFLDAAALALKRRSDIWFLLVGAPYLDEAAEQESYMASLHARVKALGISERVVFTGYREDAYRILQNLDVLVMPSLREALGGSLIEAMAAGVPAVGSNVDGLPEVVVDGVTGLLVASDKAEDYAARILGFLEDPQKRERFSRAAFQRAMLFDQGALTRRFEALYRALMSPS